MTYVKGVWTDETLTEDARYNILSDAGTPINETVQIVLETPVAVAGTALTAVKMNNIEAGIEAIDGAVVAHVAASAPHSGHAVLASNNTFTGIQTISNTTGEYQAILSGTLSTASNSALAITTTFANATSNRGIYIIPNINTASPTGGAYYGVLSSCRFTALTATGTQSVISALYANPIIAPSATANITNVYGNITRIDNQSTGGSVITNAYFYYVSEGTVTGARTNQYGLYVGNLSNATTINRAIQTGLGSIVFGDNVNIGTTDVDNTTSMLKVTQTSTTATQPVLELDQSDASEEYINFISDALTAGYPVDTATAVGTAYARVRVAVNGSATFKYIQLYNA